MISDEPDEDADKLHDDILLGSVIGYDPPAADSGRGLAEPISDWPPARDKDVALDLDQATLAWFKANHADWREEIDIVLQAWVAMKTRTGADVEP